MPSCALESPRASSCDTSPSLRWLLLRRVVARDCSEATEVARAFILRLNSSI